MTKKVSKILSVFAAAAVMFGATFSYAGDEKTILETAVESNSFMRLVALVKNADLIDTLQGDGPFTLFAPSDEAFAKLPEGAFETLLKPQNRDKLVSILTYHVVPGRVLSPEVVNLDEAVTVNGQRLKISASKQGVQVDNANVVATDIQCSNGVIHVIDSVIFPAEKVNSDKSTSIDPRTRIQLAVAEGSVLFNHGYHEGCVEAYLTAMRDLLEREAGISDEQKESMRSTLSKVEHASNPIAKSWVLRHGMEDVYYSLPASTKSKEVAVTSDSVELLQTDKALLQQWYTVNDGVMGGKSEGNVRVNDRGNIEFFGNLSLRNNGGFASTRTKPQELDIEEGDTLVARVRGDGREYAMNIYDDTRRMAFSFRAPVKTVKGELIDVRIPLNDFYATSFGRRVGNAKLNASKVNSVGFILADKQPGPFRLEVESIQVEKAQ